MQLQREADSNSTTATAWSKQYTARCLWPRLSDAGDCYSLASHAFHCSLARSSLLEGILAFAQATASAAPQPGNSFLFGPGGVAFSVGTPVIPFASCGIGYIPRLTILLVQPLSRSGYPLHTAEPGCLARRRGPLPGSRASCKGIAHAPRATALQCAKCGSRRMHRL